MTAGDRLADRFVLKQELGRGATGVVWEAWDEAAERPVAVKLLHDGLTGNATGRRALEAEAAAAGRLRHPGVLEVYGLWNHEGRRLLVTERVSGPSLAEFGRPMSIEDALRLGIEVADALHFAHGTGRIHGDVRPGNLLLGPSGAKLFDFGLANWVSAMGMRGQLVPTVRGGESAPELLAGGTPGVAADLYGLGVILVRAATGKLPWAGATPYALMTAQRAGVPDVAQLPAGVRVLVRALLHPEPDRRPPDAAAVRRSLASLLANPERAPGLGERWLAPIRPLGAWVVHGTDPATGGPCVVRVGLPRRAATALMERLHDEGWEVAISKEALDVTDLGWAALGGLFAGTLLPALGWLLVVPLALKYRSSGLRDRLREALPPVQAQLPPKRLPPGNEVAVAAGLLLIALAFSLMLFPLLSVPILAALAWLAASAWRSPADPVEAAARVGRIETALAEAAAAIEAREMDLDENLGLHGEWLELDAAWRRRAESPDAVLLRAEDLSRRANALRRRQPRRSSSRHHTKDLGGS